ncbi:MAG: hypothetical protein WD669_00255 [Pirellulales bacterium]
MSENMQNAIAELQRHLDGLNEQAIDTKKTINSLCRVMGEPALYTDADLAPTDTSSRSFQLNGDEYFNRPLAGVVKSILEGRRERNQGPASAEEIFDQMRAGGFEFEGRSEDKALHGLKISLSKNTTAFLKLPNGKFGLAEWYGRRDSRPKQNGASPIESTEIERLDPATEAEAEAAVHEVAKELAHSKPR